MMYGFVYLYHIGIDDDECKLFTTCIRSSFETYDQLHIIFTLSKPMLSQFWIA